MGRNKTSTYKRRQYTDISEVITWRWHLPESYLRIGVNYTKQGDKWDCGPNSAGRALQMWEKNPRDFSEYSSFMDRCPKTFGMPIVYDLMPSFSTRNSPSYAQDSSQFFDVRVSRSFFTSYYTDVKDTFCLFRFTTLQRRFPRTPTFSQEIDRHSVGIWTTVCA